MEENEKTPEQLKSENNMNFAKKMSSEISSIDELMKKISTRRKITTDKIETLMEDPNKNATALQQQMEVMRACNGILKEIMFYKSNLPTFDHYLLVDDVSKYKTKDKLEKDYLKAIYELERYNVKIFSRWNIEEVLRKGELYIFKEDDGESINYFKIPNSQCKITYMKGMLQGYSIKLSEITEKTKPSYPMFIQKLYDKYKNGKLKNDKNYVDNYYKLPIENAVAFSIDMYESKSAPYYSSLLLDLSRIEDLQTLNMDSAASDNFKLIHQLLPSDKNGEITIPFETAQMYHLAVKNEMPPGVTAVSTPYKVESVTLTNNSAKNYNYITDLKNNLYNGSGVDSSLFNSENKSNNQNVIYSGIIDSLLAFNLLERIKLWLNFDFKSNKYLKNFRIVFCNSTSYNQDAKWQSAVNNSATYNGRLEMLALGGKSPLEAYSTLKMESLLGIDELIYPLANAHTQSSDKGGRPTTEENGDPNIVSTSGEN